MATAELTSTSFSRLAGPSPTSDTSTNDETVPPPRLGASLKRQPPDPQARLQHHRSRRGRDSLPHRAPFPTLA